MCYVLLLNHYVGKALRQYQTDVDGRQPSNEALNSAHRVGFSVRTLLAAGAITLYVLSILGLIGIGPWSGQFSTCVGILAGIGGFDFLNILALTFCAVAREDSVQRQLDREIEMAYRFDQANAIRA